MNHNQGLAGPAEDRLKANHPSLNSRPANRGKPDHVSDQPDQSTFGGGYA